MKKYILIILVLGAGLAGCGKVSQTPLSPLINPAVYNNFDQGLNNWGWRYQKYLGIGYDNAGNLPSAGLSSITASQVRTFDGSAGSAKIDVTFGQVGDSIDSGYTYTNPTDVGFEGKVLSAWVYWDSGLVPSNGKVIAKFYIKLNATGNSYAYSSGSDATLVQGRWVQATFAVNDGYNSNFVSQADYLASLSKVREWGVELYASTGPFTPGTVYLDQVAF